MQSSKEEQGEIRKPSSVNSTNKQREVIQGKRLEISSRKLDNKGTFQANMGAIKERNGMHLTEAEDIKKWQECTELYKKKEIFMMQTITMV